MVSLLIKSLQAYAYLARAACRVYTYLNFIAEPGLAEQQCAQAYEDNRRPTVVVLLVCIQA